MTTQVQMHKYVCHKEEKILHVSGINCNGEMTLFFDDSSVIVDADYINRHNPAPNGYYVVYKDGYKSWSPAKAFEEGYTLIEEG